MAIRGVYTEEEKKWIAEVEKVKGKESWLGENFADDMYPLTTRVATRDAIRHFCNAIGDENPLWRDEEYAKNTRWGGIIAPPSFVAHIAASFGGGFRVPPSLGQTGGGGNAGTTYNFYKPIRVNDSFRVKDIIPISFEDKTRRDGKGPRQFLFTSDRIYINQKDEVVCVAKRRTIFSILPPVEEAAPSNNRPQQTQLRQGGSQQPELPACIYTKEEIEYIDRAYEEWGERRGAEPRYWEDVDVGEELPPLIHGPRTEFEQACAFTAMGYTLSHNLRIMRKHSSWVWQDPETGYLYDGEEGHISHAVATRGEGWGNSSVITMGIQTDWELMFLITNWMGDDGFLKRFDIRYRTINPLGDVSLDRGKVVRRYVENGEHLVDLAVWPESIRGWIAAPASATVVLPSRNSQEV